MSFIPLVLTVAGTAMQAVSSIQEGNAMAAAERANADIASSQAAQVRQAGAYEGVKIEREKSRTASTQRARYAKSGVLITEGSPLEVMADTAAQYVMDININQYNTDVEAGRYDYEAQYRRKMAKSYQNMGYTKAFGNVLLSAGTLAASSGLFKPTALTRSASIPEPVGYSGSRTYFSKG